MHKEHREIALKSGREESLKRFHPWIFSGAIKSIDGAIEEGELVTVRSHAGEFAAKGHYQSGSIAVRILTFADEEINKRFFENRILEAYSLRAKLGLAGNENTSVYRLVHGEGDSLPGLVIDVYDDVAVFQAHSLGIWKSREQIAEALTEICSGIKHVYCKSSATLPRSAETAGADCWLLGGRSFPITVRENGYLFEVNPAEGQKTGFFIDQRENRLLLQKYSRGASVLNLFCYTGAFSVYAAKGGAAKTLSIDSSTKAVTAAARNLELNINDVSNHRCIAADVFDGLRADNGTYDLITVDPPAFAKHHDALKNALQAYKRLNVRAIEKLAKGGILFTFSCSQAVSKQQFQQAVFSAAAITGRRASILHWLDQSPDHPVSLYHPEGDYLKGMVIKLL
ncbi:MAG: class I SAM-dependent rRNA methyltransferase [Prevotellaceae bacterium]|jgi:23S rRNA (cytosine1962-C5)-methyltransferase|nr:class I SAM-dependent rRNA methyltransferase [Prevotellaceae bacterium]